MAFENLSDKFQSIFKELRSHGRITEDDVRKAMREVRMALLEADVNFKVVKSFVNTVTERAIGQDVMNGLNPGQMVIKIVNEEMVNLMGPTVSELQLRPASDMTVIMLCGLQGAGKTTMAAKLAGWLRSKGRNPLLAACDVYRPAAIRQLQINGEKLGIPVFAMGENADPVDIAKAAISHAKENKRNVVILDTAGRLHVDEDMMAELVRIKENVTVNQTVLVIDAMTGQDAVNVATSFQDEIGIDGVILTKLDGDTRGGAALSVKAATGCPILFSGVGEKLTDIEPFYPDRMASRILGMGDVLSLIEKAEKEIDVEDAKDMAKRMQKGKFDYNDFLAQMQQMRSMGGISAILSSLPGGLGALGGRRGQMPDADETEKQLKKIEAMIFSMTKYERTHPDAINLPRKNRIAKGAGLDITEVNRIVKQFEQSRKMMKQMSGMFGGKRGRFKMPF
ncbi:MAG: signal recognition particle protein [Lachnospiraceae bacterium]|nr:signal recognition particle protein [Lachnospiraceae bacterium]